MISRNPLALLLTVLLAIALAGCAGAGPAGGEARPGAGPAGEAWSLEDPTWPPPRPIAHPPELPHGFRAALERGTRSPTGEPGILYWQQSADYRLRARLHPAERRLEGRARIAYHNESPDTLRSLWLHLIQNVHTPGAIRNEPYEVTGGVQLHRLAVDGTRLSPDGDPDDEPADPADEEADGRPGYREIGTLLEIRPPAEIPPGGTAEIEAEWSFAIPPQGAGGRMGWDGDDVFFLAYWYPQMAVYDDVDGWHTDPFLGFAEFYMGFARYEVTLEVPEGWVVRATGTLENPDDVLPRAVRQRLELAGASDTVVRVLGREDFGPGRATRRSPDGWLRWRFRADSVRDFAFSATTNSLWDAVRAPVGATEEEEAFARVEALYRETAPLWSEVARYGRHALAFHSRYTGVPYPWPHVTAVEGAAIIPGGMEFPMMTLMGDYTGRGDTALYAVTAHELAHMWVPMMVGTDEKRRGWMDEGMTVFITNRARADFFPGDRQDSVTRAVYLQLAGDEREGPMLRWTDYQYPDARWTVTYQKPATVLRALEGLLGTETFRQAYRTFHREWAFRHPQPWDLFHTFERVSGQDLGWFWRSWYYETWTLDHAVESVTAIPEGTRIVVADRGEAPMPARVRVIRVDGDTLHLEVPVQRWLAGARRDTLTVPPGPPVIRVEIDPERLFPDIRPEDNRWAR